MEHTFTHIYTLNSWGSEETVSGDGSSIFNTVAIRQELPLIINELGIQTMLDIPCGDFHWMQEIRLDIDRYIGADIVQELIEQNAKAFGDERKDFRHLDITHDVLPQVDLIFCRDCLVHFSFDDIWHSLRNIKKSGSRYLMTTTFTGIEENYDIETGDWRPINLQQLPFQFPPPLLLIQEHGIWDWNGEPGKCMGVWNINDILL